MVLFHLNTTGVLTRLPVIRGAWMFVDFFFVLSGFVITASYYRRLADGFPITTFMMLRIGRIYPLYLAVLAVFVAMECTALVPGLEHVTHRRPFTDGHTIPQLIGNIFLLQSFGLYPTLTWNGPSWSIAAEMWTYLAAALAMRMARRRFALALIVTIVASGTFLAVSGADLDRTSDWGFVRCLFGFGLGSGAWLMFERMRFTGAADWMFTAAEVAMVALAVALVSMAGKGGLTLACPPVFVLVVWTFAVGRGAVSRLLMRRPVVAVGRVSYSIYIIHSVVIARGIDLLAVVGHRIGVPITATSGQGQMKTLAGPAWMSDLATLFILGSTIAVATMTYRYVEVPCRDRMKQLAANRHARRAEVVVPSM